MVIPCHSPVLVGSLFMNLNPNSKFFPRWWFSGPNLSFTSHEYVLENAWKCPPNSFKRFESWSSLILDVFCIWADQKLNNNMDHKGWRSFKILCQTSNYPIFKAGLWSPSLCPNQIKCSNNWTLCLLFDDDLSSATTVVIATTSCSCQVGHGKVQSKTAWNILRPGSAGFASQASLACRSPWPPKLHKLATNISSSRQILLYTVAKLVDHTPLGKHFAFYFVQVRSMSPKVSKTQIRINSVSPLKVLRFSLEPLRANSGTSFTGQSPPDPKRTPCCTVHVHCVRTQLQSRQVAHQMHRQWPPLKPFA